MRDSLADPMLENPFDPALPERPYPGLRPFYSSEWPIFFGREAMIDEIINRLIDKHVVVVHGDSGSGKSSIVRAGVLVQLQQGHAASEESWQTCAMFPREDPLGNLARALAGFDFGGYSHASMLEIRHILNRGRRAPAELMRVMRRDQGHHICILVDQFEELFRFGREVSHSEAQIFVDVMTAIAAEEIPGLYAILTMRSEFIGSCARYRNLAEAVNSTQYLLPRMERAALRRAIQEPARLYGGEVTSRLTNALIADVDEDPDELPQIQHGLMRLWDRETKPRKLDPAWGRRSPRRPGTRQSLVGLEEFPATFDAVPGPRVDLPDLRMGLKQLLEEHASSIHQKLVGSRDDRGIVTEYVFRALTDINPEGQLIRRPLRFKHLLQETGRRESDLRLVLDTFRADVVNFITPFNDIPIEEDTFIDISHEAVIRCWNQISKEKDG